MAPENAQATGQSTLRYTVQRDRTTRSILLFDQTFMLLIDGCIRYKMGDHLPDKRGPTIVRALYKLWIRVWGPPQNLLSDQEGGLLSNECTRMFDKLNINRLLVGTGGSTTKGLVE